VARKWLWFRHDREGRRIALEEFRSLDVQGQAGLTTLMQRYRDGETRAKDVDCLGGGIFELRHRVRSLRFRLLFMQWGPHLVALTAFRKDQPKTPKPDLDKARDRAKRWFEVFGDKPSDTPEVR
jgi:phage-related protein